MGRVRIIFKDMQSINSFRHDKRRRDDKRNIVIALVVFLIFIAIAWGSVSRSLSGVLHVVLQPFWSIETKVADGMGTWWNGFYTSRMELARANGELTDRIGQMTLDHYSVDSLREENAALKGALGRKANRDLLLARVIVRPPRSPYDMFVIDIGKDASLAPGMVVYADGDFAVGEISDVYLHSSAVTLYSTSGSEFPVEVGSTSIATVAKGDGGGNFHLSLPKGTQVNVGDMVTMPDTTLTFYGNIERITVPENSSFQTLYFKLPFNINNLTWLYVGVPTASVIRK